MQFHSKIGGIKIKIKHNYTHETVSDYVVLNNINLNYKTVK